MLGPERRGIARKLLVFVAVVAVVGGAVAPALAAPDEGTWEGTISLSGSPATDGTTYTYDLSDLDAASDVNVSLTGSVATAWDNVSASGVGLSSSQSVSFGGDLAPVGPGGGEPVLRVTGRAPTWSYNPFVDDGDGTVDSLLRSFVGDTGDNAVMKAAFEVQPPGGGPLDYITVDVASTGGSGYNPSVEIRLVQGGADGTYGEGEVIVSDWSPSWSTGTQTVPVPGDVSVDGGQTYHLEFITQSSNGNGDGDYLRIGGDDSVSGTWFHQEFSGSYSVAMPVTIGADQSISSLSVSTDAGASASIGSLADGETVTRTLDVSTSATSLDWSGSGGGSIDYTLEVKERTGTDAAQVCVNGTCTTPTGLLADGQTANRTLDASVLQEGRNEVTVNVGDGSLSADAPTPQVGLEYSHQAASTQSMSVDAEVWTERWETSRTWASAREDASLTIPFGEHVYSVRDVAVFSNGSEVGATSTTFNGTHLVVGLGDVAANETTRVVANGTKVQVANGSLTVTDPTAVGQALDTEFRIDSRSPGFHVDVGGTSKDRWLHYTTGESWNDVAEYAVVHSSGAQSLYFPNAPAGGTATVSTLAVDVDPQTDVRLHVAKPGSLVFDVAPASTVGDSVTYNYVGASAGETYELVSLDRSGYRIDSDSGSTAVLEGDDSSETVQIRAVNSSTSDSSTLQDVGGGSGGGIPPAVDPRANPYALLALSGAIILGGVGIAAYKPHDAIPMWIVIPVLVPVVLVVIATQSPGTLRQLVAGRFGAALEQVGPALLLLGGVVVTYVIYMAAQRWLGADRTVISFKGLRGGK